MPVRPLSPSMLVPQAFGLVIKEHEGVAIDPPTGAESQHLSIDFAAVHGSQVDQRSVGHGHVGIPKLLVGDFVPAHGADGIGAGGAVQARPRMMNSMWSAG